MKLDGLLAHAAALGVDVTWADLGDIRYGEYRDDISQITLCTSLTRAQAVSTLAHELGHAHHGDRCSTPGVEQRAWEYGARLVITVEEYSRAEVIAGPHPSAIAAELGVTRRLVEAWQAAYERARI